MSIPSHSLMNAATKKTLSPSAALKFRRLIYDHYEREGRRFPWRQTRDHYRILVSEIMLQQTQTNRVVEKYTEFIAAFPDISALAGAPLRAILSVWQGLGYNRRALCLKELAETVAARYEGRIPGTVEELKKLPGLGPATAASVAAFAFNRPVVFLETNIRTVFIHHFFPGKGKVSDTDILPLAEAALDRENPRRWYNALMDYGAMLKKTGANPGRRSAHYTRQSPFEGSDRQIRGRILRLLTGHSSLTGNEMREKLDDDPRRVRHILDKLAQEGLVREEKKRYRIS
ncbi:MAG: hypothetical protein P9M08_08815 [Candidatus Erginobacter occultus]|nr:hypothetical protein [Candidatus Erginobacter occultus]